MRESHMDESVLVVLILLIIFGSIFGIFYLFFSTRNKERLALIEKGADATIFTKGRERNPAPFWKVFVLNVAVLLMGIGAGTIIAMILESTLYLDEDALYPGLIFLMAGAGLFVGFNLTKKLDQE
ncbi:DUF6249 domain-containing protein [Pseudotenacibaculum sp. MALMAid0570]|uniref:DUF6249 domain-containing protein n=1 Tax=Pseudotenacibaculum sp. MALMAid0570 TaxID=3143938 RepID=UPI0032DE923B